MVQWRQHRSVAKSISGGGNETWHREMKTSGVIEAA
jgi:hypothetical protein